MHSGMVGDLIYALPTIRALGGGILRIFSRRPRTLMTPALAASIVPLLRAQSYVQDAQYSPAKGEIDLDIWIQHAETGVNLADMVLRAFGLSTAERNRPWLTVSEPKPVARVVLHRTPRYRNPAFPWRRVLEKYGSEAVMVGYPAEHAVFTQEVGPIPFYQTRDHLELAQVIAGGELFVGNQSSPYAIAEGLKKRTVQETSPDYPNCIFDRRGALHAWDHSVLLPDL